jgi:integrase
MKSYAELKGEFCSELLEKLNAEDKNEKKKDIEVQIDAFAKIDGVLTVLFDDYAGVVKLTESELNKLIKKMKILRGNAADDITRRVLISFIKLLNDNDVLDCKIPTQPKREQRELSAKFTEDSVILRNKYLQVCNEFESSYPKEKIYENPDYMTELQCAFTFALVSQSFVTFPNLLKSLQVLKKSKIEQTFIYLTTADDKTLENKAVRVPLSLTAQILLSLLCKVQENDMPFQRFSTDDFRRWLVRVFEDRSMSYSKLIRILRMYNAERIPPVLSTILSRGVVYHSVVKNRLDKMDWGDFAKMRLEKAKEHADSLELNAKKAHQLTSQHVKVMKSLLKLLDVKKKKNFVRADVEDFAEKHSELLGSNETCQLLVEYVLDSLRSVNTVSTTYTYYSSFSSILIEETADCPLSEYDFDDLYGLFVNIIELDTLSKKNKRSNMPRKVKPFLKWYLNKRTASKSIINEFLHSPELKGTSSDAKPVLITQAEFDIFLAELKNHTDEEEYEVMEVMCILAFYAGLRRFEVGKLSLHSINFEIYAEIRVAKSKTRAGRRIVPIEYMMPAYYRAIIKNYYAKRLEETKGKINRQLITVDTTPYIQKIIYALKSFFDCKELTFHSLRHCCCSWLAAELMLSFYPDAISCLPKDFRSLHVSSRDVEGYTKLLGSGYTRATMFTTLAKFMGHASPETTIERYTHTLDFFAEYFVRNFDAQRQYLSCKQVMNLLPCVDYNTLQRVMFTDRTGGKRLKRDLLYLLDNMTNDKHLSIM